MQHEPVEETVTFTSGITRYHLQTEDPKTGRACAPPPGGANTAQSERCLLVMTDVNIYLVQSPQNGMKLLCRIPVRAVDKCSLSRNADNFVSIHVNAGAKPPLKKVVWKPDEDVKTCIPCNKNFGWFKRRHHCRACGDVFCSSCTQFLPILPEIAPQGKPVKEGERICARCEPNVTREPLSDLLINCEYKTELVAVLMDTVSRVTGKDPDWLVEFIDDSLSLRRAAGGTTQVRFRKVEGLKKEKCELDGTSLCVKVAPGISAHEEKERRERQLLRMKELSKKRKKAAKKRQALLEQQRAMEEAEAIERRRVKFAEREAAAAAAAAQVGPEAEVAETAEKKLKKKRESKKKAQEAVQAEVPEWQRRALKRAGGA